MPLPSPSERRRKGQRVTVAAVVIGIVTLVTIVFVVAVSLIPDPRPEIAVAEEFLGGLYGGDATSVYGLTTPTYQAVVFASDLELLAATLTELAGPDVELDLVGAQRQPSGPPLVSVVGYTGTSAIGPVRGVLTMIEVTAGEWRVSDVSYRFPDAPTDAAVRLDEVTRLLNEQIADRIAQLQPPGG